MARRLIPFCAQLLSTPGTEWIGSLYYRYHVQEEHLYLPDLFFLAALKVLQSLEWDLPIGLSR